MGTWLFQKPTDLHLAIAGRAILASLLYMHLHVDVGIALAADAHSSNRCIVTSISSNLHIVPICP